MIIILINSINFSINRYFYIFIFHINFGLSYPVQAITISIPTSGIANPKSQLFGLPIPTSGTTNPNFGDYQSQIPVFGITNPNFGDYTLPTRDIFTDKLYIDFNMKLNRSGSVYMHSQKID